MQAVTSLISEAYFAYLVSRRFLMHDSLLLCSPMFSLHVSDLPGVRKDSFSLFVALEGALVALHHNLVDNIFALSRNDASHSINRLPMLIVDLLLQHPIYVLLVCIGVLDQLVGLIQPLLNCAGDAFPVVLLTALDRRRHDHQLDVFLNVVRLSVEMLAI